MNDGQKIYIVSNAIAIAEACYSYEDWIREIYAHGTPVGLPYLKIQFEKARYFLWQFTIDRSYQKSIYRRRAMNLLIAHVKNKQTDAAELRLISPPGVMYITREHSVLKQGKIKWFPWTEQLTFEAKELVTYKKSGMR